MKMKFFRLMDEDPGNGSGPAAGSNDPAPGAGQPSFEFDYEKLASIVSGKQSAAEETVLKGYFKQQGLSADEMAQAIKQFKDQKAKNTPDPDALKSQLSAAQHSALEATMENKALLMAGELGVDMKTMPYLIKLADLSEVATEGKVDEEKLKESISKVLEDLPQLKAKMDESSAGIKVGAGTGSASGSADNDKLRAAFGLKEK